VLVAGGLGGSEDSVLATAELYDLSNGTWTATGSMSAERFRHTATLLANGKVLVAGGGGGGSIISLATAELYDPATGTWTAAGSMQQGRQLDTATLLPSGQVLVVGGIIRADVRRDVLNTAKLYDLPVVPTPTSRPPTPTPLPKQCVHPSCRVES